MMGSIIQKSTRLLAIICSVVLVELRSLQKASNLTPKVS
jgi:hypothetical protein